MKNSAQQQLLEIKEMMEKSSRFISLSGLSGIFVGIIALLGTIWAFLYLEYDLRYFQPDIFFKDKPEYIPFRTFFVLSVGALTILVLALASAILFTIRKGKSQGVKIWNKVTKLMLVNLLIPLIAGGTFCLILAYYRLIFLIAPATLVFYGLALLNASKYTFNEVRWLGISEIILGLIAMIFAGYGLIVWGVGFGILHIIYGSAMYFKYDIKSKN